LAKFPVGPNERDRLRVLHASGIIASPAIPALDTLCEAAASHFGVKSAIVTLLDADQQIFRAKWGIDGEGTPRNIAFCNYTILEDKVFVVSDANADDRFATNPVVTGPPFIRFYAGAPLLFQQEIRLGALCLLHPEPRTFTLGDRAELLAMADRAVVTIANFWFELGLPDIDGQS